MSGLHLKEDWFDSESSSENIPYPRATPKYEAPRAKFHAGFYRAVPKRCYVCDTGTTDAYMTLGVAIPMCGECYLLEIVDKSKGE